MRDAAFLRDTELAIINAPFEGEGWRRAVEMVSSACHSSAANLVGFGGPLGLSLNLFTGRESERAERYFSRAELWGRCNWRVNSAGAPMTVQHEAHYAAYREREQTAEYDDAVADLDMPFGCQSPLIADSRTFLGLALLRSRRDGPCDAITLERFGKLIRHLNRAIRVELALEGDAAELMVGEIGGLTSATVLLDRYGCVCALTPAAEPLAEEDGAFRLCGLTFQLRDPAENRRMEKAMRTLLWGSSEAEGQVIEMRAGRTASAPKGRWIASIVRLAKREHGLGFDPHLAVAFRPLSSAS